MSLRRRRRREPFPSFDPNKSVKVGLELLREAGVPFALVGRLAVWAYVPTEGQQFTKDVDFAVPHGSVEAVARAAGRKGYEVSDVDIGGCRVKTEGMSIDFIDRHPYLTSLYRDAVGASREKGGSFTVAGEEVPAVPPEHLVAMKLASGRPRDERDIEEIVAVADEDEYGDIRRVVVEYLGYAMGNQLDRIARRIGHPAPGPEADGA